jgi:hypothetical protein
MNLYAFLLVLQVFLLVLHYLTHHIIHLTSNSRLDRWIAYVDIEFPLDIEFEVDLTYI